MKLIWAKEARADLRSVHDFYRDIGPHIVPRIVEQAVTAARLLLKHPSIGPVVRETNKRKWRVPKTKYILIYRVEGETVRIVRVLHEAQNWQKFLG